MKVDVSRMLETVYCRLLSFYGPQKWWPADTPFEVIVGAVLTQNTNWTNVEKAINNIRERDLLSVSRLESLEINELAELIRPSGYFNVKAKRLKHFIDFLSTGFNGDLDKMFDLPLKLLRHLLLGVNGIGPETADSILLYAGRYPIFVVDAYTKRIFLRLGLLETEHTYKQIQDFFMENFSEDVDKYNEYHALIVRHAKERCNKKPHCRDCPLVDLPCSYNSLNVN